MTTLKERENKKITTGPNKTWNQAALWAGTAVLVFAVLVLAARWIVEMPSVASFLARYPGDGAVPEAAPTGLPSWVGWQHFLNFFFLVLIIRTGWIIRTSSKPKAYWTRYNKGLLRTKGAPKKISLDLWLHLSVDILWILNGLVFIVLLFSTGQWLRVVPTSWDIFPNAASVGLQYLSLNWPTEDGWIHYNALQTLSYFVTIFIAAPLAAITGFRMSPAWSNRWTRAGRIFPVEVARKIHFPVMVYFVLFLISHVTLVFSTGALRNLNHIYTASDDTGWTGFLFFAGSIVIVVVAWVLARPMFLQPVASLTGKVTAR